MHEGCWYWQVALYDKADIYSHSLSVNKVDTCVK